MLGFCWWLFYCDFVGLRSVGFVVLVWVRGGFNALIYVWLSLGWFGYVALLGWFVLWKWVFIDCMG